MLEPCAHTSIRRYCLATLASALAAGSTLVEAAMLANHAAGIVVGKVGTATATAEELAASFETPQPESLPRNRA